MTEHRAHLARSNNVPLLNDLRIELRPSYNSTLMFQPTNAFLMIRICNGLGKLSNYGGRTETEQRNGGAVA